MAKVHDAAVHKDELHDYGYIEFIHTSPTEARVVIGSTVMFVTANEEDYLIDSWALPPSKSGEYDLNTQILAAEALRATLTPPTLKGVISTSCFQDVKTSNAEDYRISARLHRLINKGPAPGTPINTYNPGPDMEPTGEEEEAFRLKGEWSAILDLLGEFANITARHLLFANLTREFPGLIVTTYDEGEGWPKIGGAWFQYWWKFSREDDLLFLRVGDHKNGQLWSAASSVAMLLDETEAGDGDEHYVGYTKLPDPPEEPFRKLLSLLERSPYPYRFRALGETSTSDQKSTVSYGYSAEEAYRALVASVGVSENLVAKCFESTPADIDERVFPPLPPQEILMGREAPEILTVHMESGHVRHMDLSHWIP